MTTVGLPDTLYYATVELASCLVTRSARVYGSEGWGFESLRVHLRVHLRVRPEFTSATAKATG
jgi:hypothetical protein